MNIPDIINGALELFGAIFIFLSIVKINREKDVKGVHWLHSGYFMFWGFWNIYYYPHLNQWYSFIGGVCVVITNTIWFLQILYYLNRRKISLAYRSFKLMVWLEYQNARKNIIQFFYFN